MFTSIKSVSSSGNGTNEDAIGFSDSFLFVMDGATTLGKKTEKDAAWFVSRVRDDLQANLGNTAKTIEDILSNAVRALGAYNKDSSETPYRNPCASISIFRRNGSLLEYYGLGDCTGTISFKDDTFQVLYNDTLSGFDERVIQEMMELAKAERIHISEARNQVEPLLIENRNKMNTNNGYWVLDASGDGISHGAFRTFSADKIHSVSLMTDGFAGICTTFHIAGDFAELHDKMFHENLEDLVKELFAVQDMDPYYDRYPRFKHRDDATAIIALF